MPEKETDNIAHRYIPAAFGAFDASIHLASCRFTVRSRATLQAMTRLEASFRAQWSFREARQLDFCSRALQIAVPIGNLIRLAREAESRNASVL